MKSLLSHEPPVWHPDSKDRLIRPFTRVLKTSNLWPDLILRNPRRAGL